MIVPPLVDLWRLRRQQWFRIESIRELQRRKLQAMVDYAHRNVTYYRRLFDAAGVTPRDIRTSSDLDKIPITTRHDVQNCPKEGLTAKCIHPSLYRTILTSGSSGIPLRVYRTGSVDAFYGMTWARTFLEDGQRPWYKIADFKFHAPPRFWFESLGIWRKTIISVLGDLKRKAEILKQARPHVVRGNAFELVDLARFLIQNGIEEIRPNLIFSMGSLLDQQSRRLLDSAFHAKVFDCYGSTEVGCIAWQCEEQGGYHVNADTLVMEIVKDGRSVPHGEKGRIVCTGLHSFDMPFVRYDLGDIGVVSERECPCGRGLPLLEHLEGRADDFFISADGRIHSPSEIVNQIKLIEGIRQFKIVQETETQVDAQVVVDKVQHKRLKAEVRQVMTKMMGHGTHVDIDIVETIPHDPSGKIRSLESKVRKEL